MKEVLSIIRPNKIGATKQALLDAGISSMHAKDCLGRGKGVGDVFTLAGDEVSVSRLIPKRMLTIVVPNKLVKKVVDVVIKINKTGKAGDGKIFVLPLADAVRVRTGENGDEVLDF